MDDIGHKRCKVFHELNEYFESTHISSKFKGETRLATQLEHDDIMGEKLETCTKTYKNKQTICLLTIARHSYVANAMEPAMVCRSIIPMSLACAVVNHNT